MCMCNVYVVDGIWYMVYGIKDTCCMLVCKYVKKTIT
jgi:hypothetical protein